MLIKITSGVASTLILLLACAACLPAWGQQQSGDSGQRLAFLGIEGTLPAGWQAQTPGSHMRLAQYRIPGPPDAQMVVYYFGPGQGGSLEDNTARWRSQFTDNMGDPVEPAISRLRDSDPIVTLVELHGNYARGMGMGSDNPVKADHALLAAVVETPRGNAYIQLWGPEATVSKASAAYLEFLKGLKPGVDSK